MTMDLILWRHAQAEDAGPGADDLARELTPEGERQAAKVAAWLKGQLPGQTRILCSPARRCEQTVQALGRSYKVAPQLAPGAGVQELLEAAQWPGASRAVLLVGHQPTLGETIAQLLGLARGECPVQKAGVWWLRTRQRAGTQQTLVIAVQSPGTL